MRFAGFWRRFLAYVIDIMPITAMVAVIFYFVFGYDPVLGTHIERVPRDREAREALLSQRNVERNVFRDAAFIVYVIYASILESSSLRATLGKRVLGISVTDRLGQRLGFGRALSRNVCKALSAAACGLGFLWVIWSKQKRGWHDYLASTLVILDDRSATKSPLRS